jgi:hypothetical protein
LLLERLHQEHPDRRYEVLTVKGSPSRDRRSADETSQTKFRSPPANQEATNEPTQTTKGIGHD